ANSVVHVSWAATTGAQSYNLYRGTTPGGEGTTPFVTGITTTIYMDTAVTNGTTYYYIVTAVNGNTSIVPVVPSESAASAEVSATPHLILHDDIVARAKQLGSWWVGASNGSNGFTTSFLTT